MVLYNMVVNYTYSFKGGAGDSVNYGGGVVVFVLEKYKVYGTIEASGETTTGGGVIFIVSQDIPLTGVLTDVTGYASVPSRHLRFNMATVSILLQ